MHDYDAVVVGSGPNGLAAAITLQQQGLSVLVIEGKDTLGGGMRSAELTLPGFTHDVCSAIHPLAEASPFFNTLPLKDHGLQYVYPTFATAHPFDKGDAAVLDRSSMHTARMLGKDKTAYLTLIEPIATHWSHLAPDVLGPLGFPRYPFSFATFGIKALQPAALISKLFLTKEAKGLWAGMSGHSMLPFTSIASAGIGLVLLAVGHINGWPMAKGGSQKIADALVSYFISIGGKVQKNFYVRSLDQLPSAKALLFDVTPRQLLEIAGHKFSSIYKWQLNRYRYGMGVFKIDWALDTPIPFSSEACRLAGTVHLGNTYDEIAHSESAAWHGKHSEKPFVLLAQQSLFDLSRAPFDKHTAWAYCHVPQGSTKDMTAAIENQVERFAPGFKARILAKHTMNSSQMEEYNPNYVGGDINGGAIDITQLFTRPVLRTSPYRTSVNNIFICSSSTPPGGGVHGMCGYNAAKRALSDVFKINLKALK